MTDCIDETVYNTRERAVSSDLNRMTALLHRAQLEAMAFMASGSVKKSGCFGDSFIITPQAGTMRTSIGVGLALFVDSTAVYPESQTVWTESLEIREVTHDAADAQPRYDVIEMQPGTLVSSTQPRDVFDPVTGTFTVVNLTKEIKSYPTFRIVKGTAGAVPSIPAGSAGWMPLGYVYIPGGAVSLVATDVVYARPILAALVEQEGWVSPKPSALATELDGGGVDAAGSSLVTTVSRTLTGRFPGHFSKFRASAQTTMTLSTLTSDGGFPVANSVLYWYAIPAPWPAGYDASMAPREFWTPTPSLVYSAGFSSATRQEGCLLVASATAPVADSPSGAPTGTASFTHTFFSAGASSSSRTNWVYVGACYYELAGNQIITQRTRNNLVATQRKPGFNLLASLPIAANTLIQLNNEVVGQPVVSWPMSVAREVAVHFRAALNAGGNVRIDAFDELSDDANNAGMMTYVVSNAGAVQFNAGYNMEFYLNSSGQLTIAAASQSGAASLVVFLRCYRDAILQQR